jgi:hypothetical protein
MKTNINTPKSSRVNNNDEDEEVEAQDEELAAVQAATKKQHRVMPER